MLKVLDHAIGRQDPEAVAAAAHALKGSVGLFTKGRAFEAAGRLEHRARAGDLADVERDVALLESDIDELLRSLAAARGGL